MIKSERANNKGFAALTTVLMVMVSSVIIMGGFAFMTLREVKVVRQASLSAQTVYAAESGVEDAIYRLVKGKNVTTGEIVEVGLASARVSDVSTVGSLKTIALEGVSGNVYRTIEVSLNMEASEVGFPYGVQVGSAGLTLGNSSVIDSNVYSNGNILGGGRIQSQITGSAVAAGMSSIRNIEIRQNAQAYSADECLVAGTLTYVTTKGSCLASSTAVTTTQMPTLDFPITAEQTAEWKAEALAGGTQSGFTIANGNATTTGPKKITGNVTLGDNVIWTIKGTVHVTGTLTLGNNVTIQLDGATYGSASGMIITDGTVNIGNYAAFNGTPGQSTSFVMLYTTYSGTHAIDVGNNLTGSIFYAPNGTIYFGNGFDLYQASANGINIANASTVVFNSGIQNVFFTSGKSAAWVIKSWKEIY